ncbi:MAG: AP-3 complex subunit delta [Lasallia pustulata]|uniref:AP-3 complex subunit delta n=1 Tax=Lasallia pustulata TaxID=136370 RepID=A0A5M8Q368_9LECA|nr:MAG: AP-3 complex subunit delta [Lasallia pustulata]
MRYAFSTGLAALAQSSQNILIMFEKSLYDLIRGLRNHKGNEREYIQNSLRECRTEIKGSDMDVKATALLKLVYLEMFGHDMSWASFHVLEVMSSPKYLQKRVGYLGAVQSFRPDTEVLMLATNLLKKDITSPLLPTMSLPMVTIPHIITPSLALSLLSDLLPRTSHSHPTIRKKTIAALYRLALVYPETLRHAWPKIKDLLMDEHEDPSVTAAVINIVCELGWRRPRDFLSLAPRLFDLLVDGGNNWMAIKIIKLFATLTPLEPRLMKKLLPPLSTLIRTTPAMSLLYECINGIVQGGILEGTNGAREGEEIASLCVDKLRGMVIVEGDPNLKYVALLAFNKIVISHPHLVSMHQDVILSCIDDPDISIRLQALDLGASMVNRGILNSVVDRLMRQLSNAPVLTSADLAEIERKRFQGVEPAADSDDEDPAESLRQPDKRADSVPSLPDEYRVNVIRHILGMCSRDTYANITDFDWYIDVLVRLVRLVPSFTEFPEAQPGVNWENRSAELTSADVSSAIGSELRNVAVRVRTVRAEAVGAADSLIAISGREQLFPRTGNGGQGVLPFAAWIVGEYADSLPDRYNTLTSLLHHSVFSSSSETICAYLQAVPKVFASIAARDDESWGTERQSLTSLLLARIAHLYEPLTKHPNLEVQERSVEFLELMRVAAEAVASHAEVNDAGPLLLTGALPSLFTGMELNPVAPSAQRKVPLPDGLNLDEPFNHDLAKVLQRANEELVPDPEYAEAERVYHQRPTPKLEIGPAREMIKPADQTGFSYQHNAEEALADVRLAARQRAERNKDDPFYIAHEDTSSGTSTPFHDILKSSNGEVVDIDSIPIMELDLGDRNPMDDELEKETPKGKHKRVRHFQIATDENIDVDDSAKESTSATANRTIIDSMLPQRSNAKRSLLEVDSSGLVSFSLEDENESITDRRLKSETRKAEEEEMERALKEVERVRLEMQRASERVAVEDGTPLDGTVVKKKKKKKKLPGTATAPQIGVPSGDKRTSGTGSTEAGFVVKAKKKKKVQKPEV